MLAWDTGAGRKHMLLNKSNGMKPWCLVFFHGCYHTIDIDFDGVNPNNVDIKITFKLLTYTTSTIIQ
jgi:hypothetical protein